VRGGLAALLQYRDLAGAVHDRQFVREAFFLSDCDYSILFFLCFVRYLYGLPESNMSLVITSKDTIQKP
jgi:hypothetical protein